MHAITSAPEPFSHNVTEVAYAKMRGDRLFEAAVCVILGVLAAATGMHVAFAVAALAALFAFFRPRAIDCSLCATSLAAPAGRCPGCAAAIRGRR